MRDSKIKTKNRKTAAMLAALAFAFYGGFILTNALGVK